MNYYKKHWDEPTGEALTAGWGTSTWYFETGDDNYVTRQLQVFENGKTLTYDTGFTEDTYGGLSDQALDKEEFDAFKITQPNLKISGQAQKDLTFKYISFIAFIKTYILFINCLWAGVKVASKAIPWRLV